MIDKKTAFDVLSVAVSGGADFAEIFCETTRTNSIVLADSKIEKITDNVISGVGIRAFLGTQTVYASTCDISREGLLRCAAGVADAIGQSKREVSIRLTERIFHNAHPIPFVAFHGVSHGFDQFCGEKFNTFNRFFNTVCTFLPVYSNLYYLQEINNNLPRRLFRQQAWGTFATQRGPVTP